MNTFKVEGLPESIRVGPFDIRLVVQPMIEASAEGNYGSFNSLLMEIRIQDTFAHWSKACDTLLHEIMHAIYWSSDIYDSDAEEATVSKMSTGLLAVLRHNPALSAWLFLNLKSEAA